MGRPRHHAKKSSYFLLGSSCIVNGTADSLRLRAPLAMASSSYWRMQRNEHGNRSYSKQENQDDDAHDALTALHVPPIARLDGLHTASGGTKATATITPTNGVVNAVVNDSGGLTSSQPMGRFASSQTNSNKSATASSAAHFRKYSRFSIPRCAFRMPSTSRH